MAIFDVVAEEYDNWYLSKLGAFVDKVETNLAFSLIHITPGMRILDIGCGTGNFSLKLADMGCEVVGVDLSEEMLSIAKSKAKQNLHNIGFYSMDVYSLEFPDNSFDVVFSMAAFEFISKPKKAYSEMYRVLKPNGQLLIGTIHKDSSWGKLYLESASNNDIIFKNAHLKTHKDLELLDPANLIKIDECLFLPPEIPDENINDTTDREYSKTESGGYICALWRKPL